jgi:leukotriene-A4 hydrolase
MPVLMSALRQSPAEQEKWVPRMEVEYVYDQVSGLTQGTACVDVQPVAMPSYLIAIASGELVYRPFKQLEGKNWRTGVWTEPQLMDAAFWEFSEDTPK